MRNVKRAEKIINALRTKWGKRARVDYRVLCRTLNREFKSLHVKFVFRARPYIKFGNDFTWCIEGFYAQRAPGVDTSYEPLYDIRIIRKANLKYFNVNKWFWNELFLVLVHEFKHAQQYRARRGRMVFRTERPDLNEKADKYFCSFDEIDAHAYEAAYEWKLRGGDMMKQPHVKRYYSKCRRKAMPEWRRFIAKVYKYYHQL